LQREDYCHKVTTDLTKRYRILIFEKLSISNMVKNHNMATSILDATWYEIKQLAGLLTRQRFIKKFQQRIQLRFVLVVVVTYLI
jgi:hypothetical protein